RPVQGHVGTGDGSSASATIGLQHITVQPDRALAELGHVYHGTQRTPNEALNFLRTATQTASRGLAHIARARGPRQHAVLGSHPASPAVAPEGWDRLLY